MVPRPKASTIRGLLGMPVGPTAAGLAVLQAPSAADLYQAVIEGAPASSSPAQDFVEVVLHGEASGSSGFVDLTPLIVPLVSEAQLTAAGVFIQHDTTSPSGAWTAVLHRIRNGTQTPVATFTIGL